jgi:hypothetical protein
MTRNRILLTLISTGTGGRSDYNGTVCLPYLLPIPVRSA